MTDYEAAACDVRATVRECGGDRNAACEVLARRADNAVAEWERYEDGASAHAMHLAVLALREIERQIREDERSS